MTCWDYWVWGVTFGLLYFIDWILFAEILDIFAQRRLERILKKGRLK